jgi:PhzF family phenazine biosynthesis protein
VVSSERSHRFAQVDVFSARAGMGNPLAVVFDAERLDDAQMQAIASWTNLAETTFLLPPSEPGAHYRVRIFTTQREIAFAGHPSIGTAHAVLAAGLAVPESGLLLQQCQAGLLPVRIEQEDGSRRLSVRVPRSRIVRYAGMAPLSESGAEADDGEVRRALEGCRLGSLAPCLVEGGRRWWLAELADEAEVRGMRPELAAIRALASKTGSLGLCVFARCGDGKQLAVRAFPLGVGINEDPASGAANAAIAAFLDEAGALGALGDRYQVSQGREMGRDAQLTLQIDGDRQVWVGGQCQTAIRGSLRW